MKRDEALREIDRMISDMRIAARRLEEPRALLVLIDRGEQFSIEGAACASLSDHTAAAQYLMVKTIEQAETCDCINCTAAVERCRAALALWERENADPVIN